jgi:hypothetical protein
MLVAFDGVTLSPAFNVDCCAVLEGCNRCSLSGSVS